MTTIGVSSPIIPNNSGVSQKTGAAAKVDFSGQTSALNKLLSAQGGDVSASPADTVAKQFAALQVKEIKKRLDFYAVLSTSSLNAHIVGGAYDSIGKDIKRVGETLNKQA